MFTEFKRKNNGFYCLLTWMMGNVDESEINLIYDADFRPLGG